MDEKKRPGRPFGKLEDIPKQDRRTLYRHMERANANPENLEMQARMQRAIQAFPKRMQMAAAASTLKEKAQTLPLLCVETILKFTPTSKLVRLCSIAVPLPGAFWNLGLETVLKKRLPLSLHNDLPCDSPSGCYNTKALFDITGAKIAVVKNPEMFRFCPIREFIESATLSVQVFPATLTHEPLHSYVVHGDALLSHMPNVVRLALIVQPILYEDKDAKDQLERCLNHLLPKLQAFEVSISRFCFDNKLGPRSLDEVYFKFICETHMEEMNCLQRLVLPEEVFSFFFRAFSSNRTARLQSVLSGLSSLDIGADYGFCFDKTALNFVSLSFRQLSQLQVLVWFEFAEYLAAFRALQGLTSLGLHIYNVRLTGLAFDGSNAIGSVSDLRIVAMPRSLRASVTIASFFPNIKTLALLAWTDPDLFELANSLFGERQLFPVVAKLGAFRSADIFFHCSRELLTQFLANPRLPKAVDLSQIIFANLDRDANLLTTIYCAMQASSIKRLLLRGPVNRKALTRLQSHIDLHGEMAKVSAWKDRDLGNQPGLTAFAAEISLETDFQIIGLKTSGNLKGERFTVRVFHQFTKQVDIFGSLSAVH